MRVPNYIGQELDNVFPGDMKQALECKPRAHVTADLLKLGCPVGNTRVSRISIS